MLTALETTLFETLLHEIQSTASAFNLISLDSIILKLDESHIERLLKAFAENKTFWEVQLCIDSLSLETQSKFVDIINRSMSSQQLTLVIRTSAANRISRLTEIINTVKNPQFKKLYLGELNLGALGFADLQPLIDLLSHTLFETIYLNHNALHLLQADIVPLLEKLLRNENIKELVLHENNFSSLSDELLEKLHHVNYVNQQPVALWSFYSTNHDTEFDTELNPDKKLKIAKYRMEQVARLLPWLDIQRPFPFALTGHAAYVAFRYYLELASEVNFYHFYHWWNPHASKPKTIDWQLSPSDALSLAELIVQRFPQDAHYALAHLGLNPSAGCVISEVQTEKYMHYLMEQAQTSEQRSTGYFLLSFEYFTLTIKIIDALFAFLALDDVSELRVNFATMSLDHINYLATQFAKIATKKAYTIILNDIRLNEQSHIEKLRLFLSEFPENYEGELVLPKANAGLLSEEQIDALSSIPFLPRLSLPNNQLEQLGVRIPSFMQKIKVTELGAVKNALWQFSPALWDLILTHCEQHQLKLIYNIDQEKHPSHFPSDLQYQMARIELRLRRNAKGMVCGKDSFQYAISSQHYFELLLEHAKEAPQSTLRKLNRLMEATLAKAFTKEQITQLAKVHIERLAEQPLYQSYDWAEVNYIAEKQDALKLYLEHYIRYPSVERYNELFSAFEDFNNIDDYWDKDPTTHNTLIYLEELFLPWVQSVWPGVSWYPHLVNKLVQHTIEIKYDLIKVTNMVAWLAWITTYFMHYRFSESDLLSVGKIVTEVFNYSEPEMRPKLGMQLLALLSHQIPLNHFKSLSGKINQSTILSAMLLLNLLGDSQNQALQTQVEGILQQIKSHYDEGRAQRSLVGALLQLTTTEQLTIENKIRLLGSAFKEKEFNELKSLVEQFAYSLLSRQSDSDIKNKLNHVLPTSNLFAGIQSEIHSHLNSSDLVPKAEVNKLKRRWFAKLYSNQKKQGLSQQISYWMLIQGLCELNQAQHLASEQVDLLSILANVFQLTETQKSRYPVVFGHSPNQAALFTYLGKLSQVPDKDFKNELVAIYTHCLQSLLNQNPNLFYQERYDLEKNTHLKKILGHDPLRLHQWMRGVHYAFSDFIKSHPIQTPSLNKIKKHNPSQWVLVDTDDFWKLFTCGNISGSCQRIDGQPQLNKSLLAYVMDGKNRLFAVCDQDGNIIARCIARLLYDTATRSPILFIEQVYAEYNHDYFETVLHLFAKERAKELNLGLAYSKTTHFHDLDYRSPKMFESFGSTTPWEYVDALRGQRKYGLFKIPQNACDIDKNQEARLTRSASL
jgi:hypothetical protein